MMRIVVSGAGGLLGWHASARLHARNCAARFAGEAPPFDIVRLDRTAFADDRQLSTALEGAHAVMHFAGVNRGSDEEIATGNRGLAERLASAAAEAKSRGCHVLYANSIHARGGTVYGASKRAAAEILRRGFARVSDFELPHIFGEGARPRYNNVTGTLIDDIVHGRALNVNPKGSVELLHAGEAAERFIEAALEGVGEQRTLPGVTLTVSQLAQELVMLHESYASGVIPKRDDRLSRSLFNCYRFATFPQSWPRELKLHSDPRGTLFEAVRAEGKGQVFMSSTCPGITRGNHFHLGKVERFQVVSGEAVIRIRKVLSDKVEQFVVSGDSPVFIDMPTLHTHSIVNIGKTELITLFWADEFFDPSAPDTYVDPVLPCEN